jgi:hypothetical protein
MSEQETICEHIAQIDEIKVSQSHVCDECVKNGGLWVHLRTCQTCGHTLCCDSSPSKHMSKHALVENHPVASSAEPGENWMWCYKDNLDVEYNT